MEDNLERAINLSLIKKSDSDEGRLKKDVEDIIEYVNKIQEIDTNIKDSKDKKVINVVREDKVTFKGNEFSQKMLDQAPSTHKRFFKVKKIL